MKNLPKFGKWILRLLIRPGNQEVFLGDIEEEYNFIISEKNCLRANLWFLSQIVAPLFDFFKSYNHTISPSSHMIKVLQNSKNEVVRPHSSQNSLYSCSSSSFLASISSLIASLTILFMFISITFLFFIFMIYKLVSNKK